MKTSSAKAKGRKLQQWFANLLVEVLCLDREDLESRPMGSQGEDIIMGKQSRDQFPTQSNVRIKRQSMYGKHTNRLNQTARTMSL